MRLYLFMIVILISVLSSCVVNEPAIDADTFWKGEYCVQTTSETQTADSNTIRAKVEGKWQDYDLAEFPEEFVEWNVGRRLETLEKISNLMMGKGGEGPGLDGPHNGIVASYGFKRKDSRFKLNNAVKGMGFLPKRDKIKEIISLLEKTNKDPMPKKLAVLKDLYQKADSIFAMDKQVSLELYSQPKYMTQSFLNQMVNPACTIVFMDIPCYKLKTIARLLHPKDPDLSDYEKDVVKYINLVHSYFHGEFSTEFIAVIYYAIEVYDNSPRSKDPNTGMGRILIPKMP